MDPEPYRRRQRRRAAIGWAALIAVVSLVVIVVAVGSGDGDGGQRTIELGAVPVSAEMSAGDYESIHEGEDETAIGGRLGSGLREGDVPSGLLPLFPAQPGDSHCTFWKLSDAPGHLVRLCFDGDGVLVQKSVAARGESEVPKTLA